MRGSRNFRQGGGGPGQTDKKALTTFFFFFFFGPQLSLHKSNGEFKENYPFQGSRGGPTFSRGGGGGVQLLISYNFQ